MEFKDYYATLGIAPTATPTEVKRAFRKLARKYHPDVSKEPQAEARFKDVAEAHEALSDPERRAAYDNIAQRHANGQPFEPPPGWASGFEFSGRGPMGGRPAGPGRRPRAPPEDPEGVSDFFEAMFGRGSARRPQARGGQDHHARLAIDLADAYQGAERTVTLQRPVVDGDGQARLQPHRLAVRIPQGVRPGQRLRLAGQGAPGQGGAEPGDLYLDIDILPHPLYRLDGADVFFDLPVAPWEAALGALVTAPTPTGAVQLSVPPASGPGRRLRLKGRGLPGPASGGQPPGDLYAVLAIALPPGGSDEAVAAYTHFAQAFPAFDPRAALPG